MPVTLFPMYWLTNLLSSCWEKLGVSAEALFALCEHDDSVVPFDSYVHCEIIGNESKCVKSLFPESLLSKSSQVHVCT